MVVSALVLGILGSLHCLGMCGPIAFMLPLDRSNPKRKVFQLSLYHIGRLLAYSLLGLAFGLVGKGLQLFGAQQTLSIGIGAIMILLVIVPSKYLNKLKLSKPIYGLVAKTKNNLGRQLKKGSSDTFLSIGFLNGFLPCGLVYMALVAAIAFGNPFQGALYMALFGLGTIPLMTTTVYFGAIFGNGAKQKVRKLIPVFVVLIGALFILRGLGLGIPYVSPKAPVSVEVVSGEMECH